MTRTLSAALGALFIMVGIVLSVLLAGAADAALYFRIQKAVGVEGGGDEKMLHADSALATYLSGSGNEDGLAAVPFNEREIAHMRDVHQIFVNLRRLRALSISLGMLLFLAALFKNPAPLRALSTGGMFALALFIVPLLLIAIWAAIDFHGAFDAMHRMLFDNELWLLNPETDYMIQILPQAFFARLGARLAALGAIYAVFPPLLVIVAPPIYRKWMRR